MTTNSYTRQSSFSNGDVADANLVNAEFDQLTTAFSNTVGHLHNGDVGKGALVPLIANLTNTTSVSIDTIDTANHKIKFKIDGVTVGEMSETLGFSFTNLNVKIQELTNVNTPVNNGFFRWNATSSEVDFSATIDFSSLTGIATIGNTGEYSDLLNKPALVAIATTGNYSDLNAAPTLDSTNFTHNTENMKTFLDGLETDVGTATASAQAASASADEAQQSATDAQAAAMALGVPTYVVEGGTFVIANTAVAADVVFEGNGNLTLPTELVKGRRFTIRTFSSATEKTVTINNPNFSIVGDKLTLTSGNGITLVSGEIVVLEAISTTVLEII